MSVLDGLYTWFTHLRQQIIDSSSHTYTEGGETETDTEEDTEYETIVVVGTPLRETKCLFVNEMKDFFSDAELNTVYHSKEEYTNSIDKYGYIYKSQKFQNAGDTQKLLEYACDWVKNNYHGGIIKLSITALDMHAMGENVDRYMVGDRVKVRYVDPALMQETEQTLTCISAEYDLANPDKNSYSIGIPDVTLDKVYGETSKSGGGGGGGGKPSDETDDETQTDVDGLTDDQDETDRSLTEVDWAHIDKLLKSGDLTEASRLLLQTPNEKDPTSDFIYGLATDLFKTGTLFSNIGEFSGRVHAKDVSASQNVDTDEITANNGIFANIKIGDETLEQYIRRVVGLDAGE